MVCIIGHYKIKDTPIRKYPRRVPGDIDDLVWRSTAELVPLHLLAIPLAFHPSPHRFIDTIDRERQHPSLT